MNARQIIERLGLQPLHPEGGFFRETYRCNDIVCPNSGPRYAKERNLCTAIYYLLTAETFSALHRVKSDEIFHFYAGDPVLMLQLHPDGHGETVIIGNDIEAGQQPQCIVQKGVWQGCFLKANGKVALMGTTVSPGFDYEDFELGNRQELLKLFPKYENEIIRLTRA